jgi:hypothetical protein
MTLITLGQTNGFLSMQQHANYVGIGGTKFSKVLSVARSSR